MDGQLILCRCCGRPVETGEQKGESSEDNITLLTCWNRTDKCDLCGYTFALHVYAGIDLSRYRWREEAWRNEPATAV